MEKTLQIQVNGINIAEIPEYMNKVMNDQEFHEFLKYDNSEESIEEVVQILREMQSSDGKE
jgi:hypothetical protein